LILNYVGDDGISVANVSILDIIMCNGLFVIYYSWFIIGVFC